MMNFDVDIKMSWTGLLVCKYCSPNRIKKHVETNACYNFFTCLIKVRPDENEKKDKMIWNESSEFVCLFVFYKRIFHLRYSHMIYLIFGLICIFRIFLYIFIIIINLITQGITKSNKHCFKNKNKKKGERNNLSS